MYCTSSYLFAGIVEPNTVHGVQCTVLLAICLAGIVEPNTVHGVQCILYF